jgi:hypothetical protein
MNVISTNLIIICIVLGVLGIGLFMRAYHRGSQSLNKMHKSEKSKKQN